MLEGLLLMLLAIGGTEGSPAAGVLSASPPSAVVGVWRGSWAASGNQDRVPIEAVLQTVGGQGQVAALVARGTGGARRTVRLTGTLERDGIRFELPGGGALRLAPFSASRLVGDIRGARAGGPLLGDGSLDLARVHRR
jgi:hypothetical protein